MGMADSTWFSTSLQLSPKKVVFAMANSPVGFYMQALQNQSNPCKNFQMLDKIEFSHVCEPKANRFQPLSESLFEKGYYAVDWIVIKCLEKLDKMLRRSKHSKLKDIKRHELLLPSLLETNRFVNAHLETKRSANVVQCTRSNTVTN